ncbi:MAG: efflux RND transporter permease subunit [Robiginitomaculum sp.]|nr:efflux RND transporter permease subunit [Robiginitomaculum sp.]
MRGLIAWWAKNPVAANLLMLAIIFVGLFGFFNLEREIFPGIKVNEIQVQSTWQGASPRDMQEQIITRIEEAVYDLDGIDNIQAIAFEGGGRVTIKTKVNADFDRLLDEIKTRVDGIINLPPDAFRPTVRRTPVEIDYMYMALHGDMNRLDLQLIADDVRREMAELFGGELTQDITRLDREITIEISEDKLRQFGLTFQQVATAISGASVNLSAGEVRTSAGRLQLRTRALADSAPEFEKIIIRQSADGGRVMLKDIATVLDGFQDIDFTADFKGQEAVFFRVISPDKPDVSKTGKAFRKYIKEKNETLPPELTLSMWGDFSVGFDSRMSLIGSNALMGMILVLLILTIFLRPAVAIWVTVGITVSFLGAFAIAPFIGISLNMISTFAFLLVIGIVVDDAIVVGESVHFHVEHGISGTRGSIAGANMVSKPVIFAVITTIMVFLPWMFLSGSTSDFTSQISLVVMAALVFSLIEAFFILPSHLRHLKPLPPRSEMGPFARFQTMMADSLVNFARRFFRPFIAAVIKFRYATLAIFFGLFYLSISAIQANLAKVEMFPDFGGDMLMAQITFPEGTSFDRLTQVQKQLEDAVVTLNKNVEKDFGVEYDLIPAPGSFANGRNIQSFLGLAPAEQRGEISSTDIAEKLEEYLGPVPDAFRITISATGGRGGGGQSVSYAIASDNEADLSRAMKEFKAHLSTYGNVSRTWDSLESSSQEMQFSLKPGAESLGITLASLTRQVREAFFGREVQRLPRNGDDVRVVLRYPKAARDSIDSLQQLRIRTASGTEVPLYSVADITFAPGISRINRRDRKQVISVGAVIRGGPQAKQVVQKDITDVFLPKWELSNPNAERLLVGADDEQSTLLSELRRSGIFILFAMYFLLAVGFRSYSQPLLILIAIPFAFVGMVFGAIVTGTPLGIMSGFGFFAAAGVAVNDNLVLLDYVNRLTAKGVGAYQAMIDACVARFRPILLTSVTTFVGVMPMFAENSAQAEFLKPMVVALAFGVLFDFFLTLILVPAMYGIGIDIKRLAKRIWTGERQPPLGSSYDPEMAVALEGHEIDGLMDDKFTDAAPESKLGPAPAQ